MSEWMKNRKEPNIVIIGKTEKKYRIKDSGQILYRESRLYTKRQMEKPGGLLADIRDVFGKDGAWLLFWEQSRVDLAWYDGSGLSCDIVPEALLEIRAFNEEKELHLRRTDNGSYAGRVLYAVQADELQADEAQDGRTGGARENGCGEEAGKETAYGILSEPYMWGSSYADGQMTEERGMRYHLPKVLAARYLNVGYRVMQYYVPDPEDGMLRLLDYCLTGIFQEKDGRHILLKGEMKNEL